MSLKSCTQSHWRRVATEEAAKDDVDPIKVLAGNREPAFVGPRWRAFRALNAAGYSYNAIAKASGFDRSAIGYACDPEVRTRKIAKYRRGTSVGVDKRPVPLTVIHPSADILA